MERASSGLCVASDAVATEAQRASGRVAHNSQPAACDASALVPPSNAVLGTTAAASISAAAAELAAMGVDTQFDVAVSASPPLPPPQAKEPCAESPAASVGLLAGVDAMYVHYRRDLVAVLSNVAWQRSRRLPLEAAGGGGLTEALLTHCAGDAYSPFVREWAIYGALLRALICALQASGTVHDASIRSGQAWCEGELSSSAHPPSKPTRATLFDWMVRGAAFSTRCFLALLCALSPLRGVRLGSTWGRAAQPVRGQPRGAGADQRAGGAEGA